MTRSSWTRRASPDCGDRDCWRGRPLPTSRSPWSATASTTHSSGWPARGLALGGTGADIAAEAGDIVLMGAALRPLPLLVKLSRQTVRIIHQNIIWFAFVVNAIGIVVTAWLWPLFALTSWVEQSPLAAVIYHQIGSLAVLLNSMRCCGSSTSETSPMWINAKARLREADLWLEKRLDLRLVALGTSAVAA